MCTDTENGNCRIEKKKKLLFHFPVNLKSVNKNSTYGILACKI